MSNILYSILGMDYIATLSENDKKVLIAINEFIFRPQGSFAIYLLEVSSEFNARLLKTLPLISSNISDSMDKELIENNISIIIEQLTNLNKFNPA